MADLRRWAGLTATGALAMAPGALTACTSDASEAPGSVTEMVGTLAADQAITGQYFSFQRFADGSGVDLEGPAEEVLTEVFADRSADGMPGEPFTSALRLMRTDELMIDPASVTATYKQPDTNGATVLLGDFDAEEVEQRVRSLFDGSSGPDPLEVTSAPEGDDLRIVVGRNGDPGGSPTIRGVMAGSALVVSEDRLVVLPRDMSTREALAEDVEQSRLADDDVRKVTEVLDEAEVYAAAMFFEPIVPEGGGTALAGGVGTGFHYDDEVASTVLIHEDTEAAEANRDAVEAIMEKDADCADEVDVRLDGPLLVASCKVEEARWVGRVLSRLGLSPFRPA